MLRILGTTAVLILLLVGTADAQSTGEWETLFAAPPTTRYNDAFFLTPDLGWVVNGEARILKTSDGGVSWEEQFSSDATHLRSVAFLDSLRGFAGNVGRGEFGTTDRNPLYRTDDGGETWAPMGTFHGRTPAGLCGMYRVNDSMIVAVGRVRGPASFIKTVDGGKSWTSKDMEEYAAGLIDVYFSHPDTGLAVGLTDTEHANSRGVVLATTDGGESWETRYTTSRTGEWAWKLSFPTDEVGYASLQRNNNGPIYILKTSDRGSTWEEKLFSQSHYFVQGIGFVDEMTGWIGGNSSDPPFVTVDGGETWRPADIGRRLNRFRFLGDSLGYAAGERVHKFDRREITGIASGEDELPRAVAIHANHPNPFASETHIAYSIAEHGHVTVSVYDVRGRRVKTLTSGALPAGSHSVLWDGADETGNPLGSGIYFAVIRAGAAGGTQPMLLLR